MINFKSEIEFEGRAPHQPAEELYLGTMMRDRTSLFRLVLLGTAGVSVLALLGLARSSGQGPLAFGLAAVWGGSHLANYLLTRRQKAVDPADDRAGLLAIDAQALNIHAMVVKTDRTGRISFVNDHFLALTGFAATDLIGHLPAIYGHVDEADVRDELARAHAAGDIWTGTQRIVGKTGDVFNTQTTSIPRLDRQRRAHGAVTVHTDLTQQQLAAGSIDTAKSLHLLSDPVFMVSARTHDVVFANDAALRLFGWHRDRLTEVRMEEVALACDRRAVMKQIAAIEAGEIEHFNFDAVYNDQPFQGHIQMIQADDIGKRLYVVLRDQVAIQALSRAKDELVATVSHELRTPLTSIKGALGLIRSGTAGELTEKISGLLDIAYRNADRLVLIVNDILDLEKLAAGQMEFNMECQDIVQTVRESIAANESFAARFGVSIALTADETPAWVVYDADRIHQVMTNLISNACKFSPSGARIDVTVSLTPETCQVVVADSGAGIPAGALERIFDRFTQVGKTDRARKGGTGLGLSIVKSIIESHGGTITLASIEGQGTTATVAFHRAPAPVSQPVLARTAEGSY